MVLNTGDGRGEAGVVTCKLDETRLVKPDGAGATKAFLVGLEQRFALGGNRVIDGIPVAVKPFDHL